MDQLNINSSKRNQLIDITPQINHYLSQNNYLSGIIIVNSPHTTAGITVNENADPDVKTDIIYGLNKLVPNDPNFKHCEGNSDAHLKSSLMGFSQTFIVENGSVQLGTWQSIYFVEFDGPRNRKVWLKFINN